MYSVYSGVLRTLLIYKCTPCIPNTLLCHDFIPSYRKMYSVVRRSHTKPGSGLAFLQPKKKWRTRLSSGCSGLVFYLLPNHTLLLLRMYSVCTPYSVLRVHTQTFPQLVLISRVYFSFFLLCFPSWIYPRLGILCVWTTHYSPGSNRLFLLWKYYD